MSASEIEIIVENSKVSLPVPVINGCYLHSRFNPLKEAEEFATKNFSKIKDKKNIIVMGLGFGYHVNELIKQIQLQGITDYKVLVVEPNKKLVDKFNEIFSFDDPNVSIINHENVEDFFFDDTLLDFFGLKPAMLSHRPSFNLNTEFFTKFLSYKAPKEIGLYAKTIEDENVREYFENQTGSLEDIINETSRAHKIENKNDFLVQIIGELR
jgi:hypothetical protein